MSMWPEVSPWQCAERRCLVVLREVFSWLGGAELSRAGGVCRAWRHAAHEPALWRRLLPPPSAGAHLRGAAWRDEYVRAHAAWEPRAPRALLHHGAVLHAALHAHRALALATDTAHLAVWVAEAGAWREAWSRAVCEGDGGGWVRAHRVAWASAARPPRLLVAGQCALVPHWELRVVQLHDDYGYGHVMSRARCSAGAAGCWLDPAGDAFLSLELQLLGPGLACTTFWLNSAAQETQSEHAGVRAPLLRAFNEGGAAITHVVATEASEGRRTVVGGSALGLAAWRVWPALPPVVAGPPSELGERATRLRARRRAPPPHDEAAAPPDEAAVRALCVAPDAECRLPASLIGLALHPGGAWVCAVCSEGSAWRVCARSLRAVAHYRAPRSPQPRSPTLHYVQPAATDHFVASPAGGYSPAVWVWAAQSGVAARCDVEGAPRCAPPALPAAPGSAPPVCALLAGAHLLVVAGARLYEWRSRAHALVQHEP